jgi:hypothetical protein
MALNDYPHFYFADDGRLCSTCQHCLGFPRVLYDALIRLGYNGDAPVYHCRLSIAHNLDRCEVSVMYFNGYESTNYTPSPVSVSSGSRKYHSSVTWFPLKESQWTPVR